MKSIATLALCCGLIVGLCIGVFGTRIWHNCITEKMPLEKKEIPSSTRASARMINVPSVSFEEVTLLDAVDYFRLASRTGLEIDSGPHSKRLNFIVIDPDNSAKPFSLRLRDVQLDKLCDYTAELSGVDVAFEEDAIVFRARTKSIPHNSHHATTGSSGVCDD